MGGVGLYALWARLMMRADLSRKMWIIGVMPLGNDIPAELSSTQGEPW
jgi:hypothetical protein